MRVLKFFKLSLGIWLGTMSVPVLLKVSHFHYCDLLQKYIDTCQCLSCVVPASGLHQMIGIDAAVVQLLFARAHSVKQIEYSGPGFNIKMPSYQYRKSHCGDKTILRPSYHRNGISCTDKMTFLYWIKALVFVWWSPAFKRHAQGWQREK